MDGYEELKTDEFPWVPIGGSRQDVGWLVLYGRWSANDWAFASQNHLNVATASDYDVKELYDQSSGWDPIATSVKNEGWRVLWGRYTTDGWEYREIQRNEVPFLSDVIEQN